MPYSTNSNSFGAEDNRKAREYCAKAENAIQYLTNSESATAYALLAIYYKLSALERKNVI